MSCEDRYGSDMDICFLNELRLKGESRISTLEDNKQIVGSNLVIVDNKLRSIDNTLDKVDDKLRVVDGKLDQIPIISTVLQEHANSIEEVIAENRLLRDDNHKLSDRLDSISNRFDSLSKFVCSAFESISPQEQAQKMYGLLCPPDGHDEL